MKTKIQGVNKFKMKIKDIISKVSNDQYILEEISTEPRKLALTNCTVDDRKHICIDFGNRQERYLLLDVLLITLKEMYGAEYIIEAMNQLKPYEEIKEAEIIK